MRLLDKWIKILKSSLNFSNCNKEIFYVIDVINITYEAELVPGQSGE